MRNIKNMTLFCQIQSKTIISSRIYTNNYRKYIYIAKTLFVKNQLKSSKNQALSAKKARKNNNAKNIRVKTSLTQAQASRKAKNQKSHAIRIYRNAHYNRKSAYF